MKRNGETTTNRDKQPIVTNNHNENVKGGNKGAVPVEKKRKVGVIEDEVQVESKESIPVKYIGETSRSAYERLREHYRDRENISVKSHMMKHYIEKHRNIRLEEMKFGVKIVRTYRFYALTYRSQPLSSRTYSEKGG